MGALVQASQIATLVEKERLNVVPVVAVHLVVAVVLIPIEEHSVAYILTNRHYLLVAEKLVEDK